MADQGQSKPGMNEQPQRDIGGQTPKEHEPGVKTGGTVGTDVPDESKERHTEIAVDAGRKGGEHPDDKR